MSRNIFAFYNLAPLKDDVDLYWKYEGMPSGWWWVGQGYTTPVAGFCEPVTYRREEQFNGPAETYDEMMQYLTTKFKQLKEIGRVEKYCLEGRWRLHGPIEK